MAPTIVSRAQWGARTTIPAGRYVAPTSRRWFIVHWPGGTAGTNEIQMVRNIEAQHQQLGWVAPGYSYLVGRSGTIYEGCGRDVRGVHSPPHNTDGWGVQVMISINETPPPAALNATRALYDMLCGAAGKVLGKGWHSMNVATGCPGPALTAWVQRGMPVDGAPAPEPEVDLEEEPMQVVDRPDGGRDLYSLDRRSGQLRHFVAGSGFRSTVPGQWVDFWAVYEEAGAMIYGVGTDGLHYTAGWLSGRSGWEGPWRQG